MNTWRVVRSAARVVFSTVLLATSTAFAQDAGTPGPRTPSRTTVSVTRGDGSSFAAEVHYPAASSDLGASVDSKHGRYPIAAFGHGFLCPVDRYRSTAAHLASWGIVVILPETQGGLFPSHPALAADLVASLDWLAAEGDREGSFWSGAIDGTERGLLGHSMGGGAALLAAAADPRTDAVCVLAAANTNPSSISAASSVRCATRLIVGEEDSIVPPASTVPMYENLPGSRQEIVVLGGFHCGFIDQPIIFCDSGAISRGEQLDVVHREMAEFLLLHLRDDLGRWDEVWGNPGADDGITQVGRVTADLDGNGRVDGGDLGLLVANWENAGCGDLNEDGIVDGADLGLLIAAW